MSENKQEGVVYSKIYGNNIIKCVGDNFTGNIKIDVQFDEQTIENKKNLESINDNALNNLNEDNKNNYM
ncbi:MULTISPECIES: hypothetical protein [Caloramator]|uniref:Uncharacterized protein n=1 Tax=Caloramator proteoclasticus DSM 10124 TaxID=1121262 RepID=A0A1M5C529_9CLOT|nr:MULTISPECIES: hypothetical protein [Caloramator]SHF49707.1 hypothetical protein SAMN02746091_02649 [Caloramator proteoclasticus DSM 10124]